MPISVEKYNTPGSYFARFWEIVLTDLSPAARIMLAGFLILTLYYCIFGKGRARVYFGIQSLLLLLFLEPHVMFLAVKALNLDGRYFRFLWIFPYGVTYGYFVTRLLFRIPWKTRKAEAAAAYTLSAILLAAGAGQVMAATANTYNGPEANPGMLQAENIYKIEDDTIEVSDIIATDQGRVSWARQAGTNYGIPAQAVTDSSSETASRLQDAEGTYNAGTYNTMVKVLYGYDTFIDMRTYDPSIYSGFTLRKHNTYRNRAYDDATLERVYGEERYDDFLCLLINGEPSGEITFPVSKIRKALTSLSYQYIIVPKQKETALRLFSECGDRIGESKNYLVIRISE